MKLRHDQTLMPALDKLAKVTACCWSPNHMRLAVVTVDRVVHLFDEQGVRRDKFMTKGASKTDTKAYLVTGMAWSPDSSLLAVAQSDNIVFIYKVRVLRVSAGCCSARRADSVDRVLTHARQHIRSSDSTGPSRRRSHTSFPRPAPSPP